MTPSLTQAETIAPGPYYAMPSWDQTLPAATRFIVLSNFNSEAVLDRETGLLWERSPSGTTSWSEAFTVCAQREVGGRKGWHLPMIEQLSSLVDSSGINGLPVGNPFQNITMNDYLSATTVAFNQDAAWVVEFSNKGHVSAEIKVNGGAVWCVRGGQSFDGLTP
ncbi:DUF1566 domain-containing protein [Nitrospira sp. NS4]|uniref:Lcl C-terminal domain-containing protein n=1 Tax=Nitrospira sp. NS4 TaxID=3414498 RepID=UPI003C2ACF99